MLAYRRDGLTVEPIVTIDVESSSELELGNYFTEQQLSAIELDSHRLKNSFTNSSRFLVLGKYLIDRTAFSIDKESNTIVNKFYSGSTKVSTITTLNQSIGIDVVSGLFGISVANNIAYNAISQSDIVLQSGIRILMKTVGKITLLPIYIPEKITIAEVYRELKLLAVNIATNKEISIIIGKSEEVFI